MRSFHLALLVLALCAVPLSQAAADPVPDTPAVVVQPAAPVVAPVGTTTTTTTVTAGSVATVLPSPDDPVSIVQSIIGAGKGGQWWMLGSLIAMLLIWISRSVLGKFIPWFATDRGGAVLALIVGLLGAIVCTFATGKPTWNAVTDGLKLALTAIGGYVSVKKIAAPADISPV